jgi:hypothetical protein
VTVLEGKRHDARIARRAHSPPSNYGPRWGDPGAVCLPAANWGISADEALLPKLVGLVLFGVIGVAFICWQLLT